MTFWHPTLNDGEQGELSDDELDELREAFGGCRECGCSELEACEGGCIWVEPDLCSRCAREQ